jgi:hypothetical protein
MGWTETARREYDRSGLRYASDCTDDSACSTITFEQWDASTAPESARRFPKWPTKTDFGKGAGSLSTIRYGRARWRSYRSKAGVRLTMLGAGS